MKFKDTAWVVIAVLILVTAVLWLAITVKTTLNKETVPANLEKLSKPLNPNLDQSVFVQLKSRSDE